MPREHASEETGDGDSSTYASANESPRQPGSSRRVRSRFLQVFDPRRRRNRSRSTGGRSDTSEESEGRSSTERQHAPVSAVTVTSRNRASDNEFEPQLQSPTSPGSIVPPSNAELTVSMEVWNAAYNSLGESNSELRAIYEKVLSNLLVTSAVAQVTMATTNLFVNCEPDIRLARMKDVTTTSLKKLERRATVERELIAAAGLVKSLCGFVGTFISAYPPAALALSGVSAVLPVRPLYFWRPSYSTAWTTSDIRLCKILVMPLQANRDMAGGLKHVLQKADWYMALCQLLLREKWADDNDFRRWRDVLKARVTALYAALLGFQMKCVCQCYHDHPVAVGIRVMLGRLDWKSELNAVKDLEMAIVSEMQDYNNQVGLEFLRSIKNSSQELLTQLEDHFREAAQARIAREEEERRTYQSKLTGRFKTTPYDERMKLNDAHIAGTCEWFCNHEAFQSWLAADPGRILLVSADPGCGKSVLATYLIKTVLPLERPDASICYFFFKDNPEQRELSNAYSAILHGLFSRDGILADRCKHPIEKCGDSLTQQPGSLWSIFSHAVSDPTAGPVICILDALDECSPDGLKGLISNLMMLYSTYWGPNAHVDVRFLLTTRGYPTILDEFKTLDAYCIQLAGENEREVRAIQKEIDLVVNHRLSQLATKKNFAPEQKKKLKNCLRRHGEEQRTYLWAKLIFEVLDSAYPINNDEWEHLVDHLPRTVSTAYAKLLERVQPDQREHVMTLLQIILSAYRPLSLREMNIAVTVRNHLGKNSVDSMNMVDDQSFRKWIINTCGFFVTEYGGKVYLIHQTAKEFLLGQSLKPKSAEAGQPGPEPGSKQEAASSWSPTISLDAAHATFAESCISYLTLETYKRGQLRDLIVEFMDQDKNAYLDESTIRGRGRVAESDLSALPGAGTGNQWPPPNTSNPLTLKDFDSFCDYVLRFWPSHFRHGQRFDQSRCTTTDIQERFWPHYTAIFDQFFADHHPGLLYTLKRQRVADIWSPLETNTLFQDRDGYTYHFAQQLGVVLEISGNAMRNVENANSPLNSLALAALWGHLRILQEEVMSVTTSVTTSNTWRQWVGLEGQTSPGPAVARDQFPVICAVAGNSVPCLEFLISKQFPVNFHNFAGETPLHWAARMGYSDVLSCLLDHGARIDEFNFYALPPLFTALESCSQSKSGGESTARILIARNANLKTKNLNGDTPLHLAARLYAGYEVDPDFDDKYKNSLVKLLVDKGASLTDQNGDGNIPLTLASGSPYSTACLLRSGADPNAKNRAGRTPLVAVITSADVDLFSVVTLLLDHGADPEVRSPNGSHPLHLAAASGLPSVASALLRRGADIHAHDSQGRTPVRVAMTSRRPFEREEIVTVLLAAGANTEDKDEEGRTLLHYACAPRESFVVRRLLDNGAHVMARDKRGNTPLHYAVAKQPAWNEEPWIEKIVRQLISQGANPEDANDEGLTPRDVVKENDWPWLESNYAAFFGDRTANVVESSVSRSGHSSEGTGDRMIRRSAGLVQMVRDMTIDEWDE